ncbi:hypothetical protein AB1N83_004707 [Pleurotus pulmonarius]
MNFNPEETLHDLHCFAVSRRTSPVPHVLRSGISQSMEEALSLVDLNIHDDYQPKSKGQRAIRRPDRILL